MQCEQSFSSHCHRVTVMLHVLPTEVTLSVLSHLPIPSLLSLRLLSRQWLHFFTTNQSAIFHRAALLHEYIQPETLSLEDALSMNTGQPRAGSTSWKDFCKLHLIDMAGAVPFPASILPLINGTSLIILTVKAADRFNYAKTGREKGALSRV